MSDPIPPSRDRNGERQDQPPFDEGKPGWLSGGSKIVANVAPAAIALVAGIWAAFLFFGFTKDHDAVLKDLAEQQDRQTRLENEQTNALMATKIAADKTSEAEGELALDIKSATKNSEIESAALTARLQSLDEQSKEEDLKLRRVTRIQVVQNLSAKCAIGRSGTTFPYRGDYAKVNPYDIKFSYAIENVSDLDVEITWNAALIYVSTSKENRPESRKLDFEEDQYKIYSGAEINEFEYPEHAWGPDTLLSVRRIDGDEPIVDWVRLGYRFEAISSSPVLPSLKQTGFDVTEGGSTGILHKGDTLPSELDMQAFGRPGQMVAITLRLGLDRAVSGTGVWHRSQMVQLPTCLFGAGPQGPGVVIGETPTADR